MHLGWVTPVKHQLSCGSCNIMATMAAAETALIKAGADLASMDLSEQWPLNCAYPFSGCAGGDAKEIANFLVSKGIVIKESDLPYEPWVKNDNNYNECKEDSSPYWNPGYKLISSYWPGFRDEGE